MNNAEIIAKTQQFVKNLHADDTSGHDHWHIFRVSKMANYLAQYERADLFIVEMAALLHDVDDWKLRKDPNAPLKHRVWLESLNLPSAMIDKICTVVSQVSFKGAHVADQVTSLEAQVVQDADRLDALGAIGIARAFCLWWS